MTTKDLHAPSISGVSKGIGTLILLALGAFSSPAISATSADTRCDQSADAPPLPDATPESLTIEMVEHSSSSSVAPGQLAVDGSANDGGSGLDSDAGPPPVETMIRRILEETQQMEVIINDLMVLSQVRNLQKNIEMEPISLDTQVQKIIDDFQTIIKEKSIKVDLTRLNPVTVTAKQTLIFRMVTNVIDNALRYTPKRGAITIILTRDDETPRLVIKDSGIGIPKDALPFIFDRFYIVEKSRSKEKGGTGLGLSIVKWIADLHQIHIQVDSQPDKGTEFTSAQGNYMLISLDRPDPSERNNDIKTRG